MIQLATLTDFAATIEALMSRDSSSVLALADIARERLRQLDQENWSPAHDDAHRRFEMAQAAGCYALHAIHENSPSYRAAYAPIAWPWSRERWKPKSPVRDCVRAGALLVAELARWNRQGAKAAGATADDGAGR